MAAVIGFVCLSVVAALGIVYWTAMSAFAGKPIGRMSSDDATHEDPVIDGEIWFVVNKLEQRTFFEPWDIKSSRIKRLNPETGVETETGLSLESSESPWPMLIANNLYLISEKTIYQVIDNSIVRVGPNISFAGLFMIFPFEMDGHVTTVRQCEDGRLRLAHLIEGNWVDGRPIVLPGPRRVWEDDSEHKSKKLLPLTSEQPPLKATRGRSILNVATFDQQFYLLFTDIQLFGAYRVGFEFDDDADEAASALAPINTARESSGWKPINEVEPNSNWLGIESDPMGLLFSEWSKKQRIVRRHPDGRWEPLNELYQRRRLETQWVVANHHNATTYVVYWNHMMGSAKICRIEGNQILLPHAIAPGPQREYLGRWKRLAAGALLGWFVHVLILACGFSWMTRNNSPNHFEFGNQKVVLASFGRRAIALVVDLILLTVSLVGLWKAGLVSALATQNWSDELLAQTLVEFEFFLRQRTEILINGNWRNAFRAFSFDEQLLHAIRDFQQHGWPLLVALMVLGLLKLSIEARDGITPGKWLVGIRTVRSTLRPCGFARALVRTALFCVDVPFAITPVPAVISMLFSESWKRIGDRVTDTIVIRQT